MSAFVVDPKTINRVLTFIDSKAGLATDLNRKLDELGLSLNDPDQLGQAMYDLNVFAVRQRYPQLNLNELPGSYPTKGKLAEYQREIVECSGPQALKSLRCWLYQCSEGSVPETKLYQIMDAISEPMAYTIVQSLPEYSDAEWA